MVGAWAEVDVARAGVEGAETEAVGCSSEMQARYVMLMASPYLN